MDKTGTIVVRTKSGAKERIREADLDPKKHTKIDTAVRPLPGSLEQED